jgi:hypothetical protein
MATNTSLDERIAAAEAAITAILNKNYSKER